MALYYSKEGLYREISEIKKFLEINEYSFGFNLVDMMTSEGFLLESVPFQTKGLRGMAIIGNAEGEDVILLNSKRSPEEQNFDCGHEMMHLALHRRLPQTTFNCFDRVQPTQDPFLEWQANEGAAEFFVPYKCFLPIIADYYPSLDNYASIERFKLKMAKLFNVPAAVIKYRIENLKYETKQFLSGVPINEIEILSAKKQEARNINIASLNQISDEDLSQQIRHWRSSIG